MSKSALILSAAKRAKEVAEEKFKARDFKAAIKHATMAKQLNPIMDGIDAYLFAYNIHNVASTKLNNGVTDWYKVLDITDVFADSETIKKHYTKMVNMVQPIKNVSAEAEGALELITRGWRILSNPTNRRFFDYGSSHARVYAPLPRINSSPHLQGQSGDRSFSRGEAPRPTRMASKKLAAVGTSHRGGSILTKIEKKRCPRCSRWCKCEKGKFSKITCPCCKKKFDAITSSLAGEVWSSSSRVMLNDRFSIASS